MSEAHRGISKSEETRRKIIAAQKGKILSEETLSEETRRKMSEARKGENNPMFGKHYTKETRKIIKLAKRLSNS
jgi:hypothetical protein